MAKRKPMTTEAARRIQSHADRTGTNQDLKARAMRAAARNEAKVAMQVGEQAESGEPSNQD